jgi:RimJ/RimL family protein N-acetyltransferase
MADIKRFGDKLPAWTPPPHPKGDGALETLSGRYVTLEALNTSHAEDLHRAFAADPGVWDYMPNGPYPDSAAYRDWIESIADKDDPAFYTLRDTQTGRCGGVASYLRITPEAGSIEVGWITFALELQRTPAPTEAMYLMMKWAFEMGYRRYEWKCDALNMASRRAAQRLGFSYEGVFRQATVYKGRNRDTAWFACIDSEWPMLKTAFETWLDPSNFDENRRQKQCLSDLSAGVLVARDPLG